MIDCGGRVLMPGLIDAHWHAVFAALPVATLLTADIGYIFLAASAEAERTLMRGFTTVRDLGGPSFALKQAIDDGLATGPRIYPSGAMITTTGGHGICDLCPICRGVLGGPLSFMEQTGAAECCRQRGRGPFAGARTALPGRFADQARGRRRRRIAAKPHWTC